MRQSIYHILLLSLFWTISFPVSAQDLQHHRWNDRVILLFAPSLQDSTLAKQFNWFSQQNAEVIDRDLKIYQLSPESGYSPAHTALTAATLRNFYQVYRVSTSAFTIILIGKDGGEKYRAHQLTPPKTIFELIDGMPMRRAEMRKKKSKG